MVILTVLVLGLTITLLVVETSKGPADDAASKATFLHRMSSRLSVNQNMFDNESLEKEKSEQMADSNDDNDDCNDDQSEVSKRKMASSQKLKAKVLGRSASAPGADGTSPKHTGVSI